MLFLHLQLRSAGGRSPGRARVEDVRVLLQLDHQGLGNHGGVLPFHALALAIGLASRLCLPQERFIVAYWGDEERHCQMPGPKKDPAGPLSLVKTFF